jgi:hypothetical protein
MAGLTDCVYLPQCPACENGMITWRVRCGIVMQIGGIWLYCYCPHCSYKAMVDWANSRGFEDYHPISDEIPIEKL